MRDGASGRSRGFGFLTFKDVKTVNIVMVKEHWLDGKIVSTLPSVELVTGNRFETCMCSARILINIHFFLSC